MLQAIRPALRRRVGAAGAQGSADAASRGITAVPKGTSGNPSGRPKGLARYIRGLVGEDGKAIVDLMDSILEDDLSGLRRGRA